MNPEYFDNKNKYPGYEKSMDLKEKYRAEKDN
jgi:hypothetical protein